MILSEYDEELHMKIIRREGEQTGEQRINLLNAKLMEQNRFNDLKRSVNDPEFQKQLLEEFHIE